MVQSYKKGHGCPRCRKVDKSNKLHLEKAIGKLIDILGKVHKDKYDYSKQSMKNCNVPSLCPLHGIFHKDLAVTEGRGCPKCEERVLQNITN